MRGTGRPIMSRREGIVPDVSGSPMSSTTDATVAHARVHARSYRGNVCTRFSRATCVIIEPCMCRRRIFVPHFCSTPCSQQARSRYCFVTLLRLVTREIHSRIASRRSALSIIRYLTERKIIFTN